MLTLVLTRHGLTDRSDPEQHLGQGIDIGLSQEGLVQARRLADRIGGERFDRILSSPLVRARHTAEAIAGGRPVKTDPRLAEMDYGSWEGLTYEQIEARDPDLRRRWVADPAATPAPGGETGDGVAARARGFLGELLAWAEGEPTGEPVVLVVAHATFNRILLCVALDVPVPDYRRRFTQGQANLTVLRYEAGERPDRARLLVLNDTAHLAAPGQAPWEPSPGA